MSSRTKNLAAGVILLLGAVGVVVVWDMGYLYGYSTTPILVVGAFMVVIGSLISSVALMLRWDREPRIGRRIK
jgi:uncharacterized membrane protein